LSNCCKEMLLPQVDSGAKVSRTCGKPLWRKELTRHCAVSWVSLLRDRFIWWSYLHSWVRNLGYRRLNKDALKDLLDVIHLASVFGRSYLPEKTGIPSGFIAAAASPSQEPRCQGQVDRLNRAELSPSLLLDIRIVASNGDMHNRLQCPPNAGAGFRWDRARVVIDVNLSTLGKTYDHI
jgi:hypothetical protein